MIAFFSACGGSEHVARRLSVLTGDRHVFDIGRWMRENAEPGAASFRIEADESLGIVSPVYFWGLPIPVVRFLESVAVIGVPVYVYTVVTYGTSTGGATAMMRRALQLRGLPTEASYAIRMVDVWTPMFSVIDEEKNRRLERMADREIESVANKVSARWSGNADRLRVWLPIAKIYYYTYRAHRSTAYFKVNVDACTGCGLCARNCPVNAISVEGGRAHFSARKCVACLRCLHHCPAFAITRGERSKRHGQYFRGGISDDSDDSA